MDWTASLRYFLKMDDVILCFLKMVLCLCVSAVENGEFF